MQRRRFSREFKVEAVKLVRERGVSVAQAGRDLDVHENVLRKWVKEFGSDPVQAFPGHGQMKPEQLEIERLRREVTKAEGRAGHPKKGRCLLREGRYMKFGFIAKHWGIWPAAWLCEAMGVSRSGFPCPAEPVAQRQDPGGRSRQASLPATGSARRVWRDTALEGEGFQEKVPL